jgi:hypothetical protein
MGTRPVVAKTTTNPKEIAAALRERVLRLTPEDIGLKEPSERPAVWGIVIETAHPDAVASLVALADGSVSLYVSDGNGCVGCGGQREVRWAGADLLQIAEKSRLLAAATSDIALPPEGYVRFYLLTRDGLSSVQTRLEDINKIDERLGVLYFAGQRVLAAIERVGAGQSLAQEIRVALNALTGNSSGVKDESVHYDTGDGPCLSVGNVVRRLRT